MCIVSGEWSYDGPSSMHVVLLTVELEDRGFIEHDWNWLLDWLVVRQGLARRILYGAANAGLSISNATYPSRCPSETTVWFQVDRSMNDPECVRNPSKLTGKGPTHRSSSNMAVTGV